MFPSLVNFLACIHCRSDEPTLTIIAFEKEPVPEQVIEKAPEGFDDDHEIIHGILTCTKCHAAYPILNRIPILLPKERRKSHIKREKEILSQYLDKIPEESRPFLDL